jgi:hypothetical protein
MTSPAVSRHRIVDRAPFAAALPPSSAPVPRPGDEHPPTVPRHAGRYRYDRRSGGWWWSPEMFILYGLPPGTPVPDTEAYLQYQHADDRARVLETRIVRADGQERDVVLIGEPVLDGGGAVTAVEGLAIDITECHPPGSPTERAQALQAEVGQLRAAMASRASIEQAKGILMLLTSCSDQVAFDLLAHISSHTHRKVRDVALVITDSAAGRTRLPDDVRAIIRDACPPTQPLR